MPRNEPAGGSDGQGLLRREGRLGWVLGVWGPGQGIEWTALTLMQIQAFLKGRNYP